MQRRHLVVRVFASAGEQEMVLQGGHPLRRPLVQDLREEVQE